MKGMRIFGQRILRTALLNRNKILSNLKNKTDNLAAIIRNKTKQFAQPQDNGQKNKFNAERLRNQVKELKTKNHELKSRLRKMRAKINAKKMPVADAEKYPNGRSLSNGHNGIESIRKKYPDLPKNQIERIEVERAIARYLMGQNSGCFYVSQILKTLEELYSVKSSDRIMLLGEIKSWIERDPLCRIVKTIDQVNHHTLI